MGALAAREFPVIAGNSKRGERGERERCVSTLTRAIQLGEYALFYNDPNLINTRTSKVLKVTAADVQRVASKYLTKENRSVIVTTPKAAPAKGGQQ